MFFHRYQGIISLDIDGTITSEKQAIHPDVVQYFSSLQTEGWSFIFLTGRSFQWGIESLQQFSFPYLLAVQNGALLFEMPDKKILDRHYLSFDLLPGMEKICHEEGTDFVVYAGYEAYDWCYYRPFKFEPELVPYLLKRCQALNEKWQALPSFHSLPVLNFCSFKCFAKGEKAKRLSQRIEKELHLHAPAISDPFNTDYFVVQATHPHATKGMALYRFRRFFSQPGPIIAAGDDYNDVSMLEKADIKIVMSTAPASLHRLADILAPSAADNGIIQGLSEAIEKLKFNQRTLLCQSAR